MGVGFGEAGEVNGVFLAFGGAAVRIGGGAEFALHDIGQGGDRHFDAEHGSHDGPMREVGVSVVDGELDADGGCVDGLMQMGARQEQRNK